MTKSVERLRAQFEQYRSEWQSLQAQARAALEQGDEQAWLQAEYRRRRLPLDALSNLMERVRLSMQSLEQARREARRDSETVLEQIREKRKALDEILNELQQLEREYAQMEPVENEPALLTVLQRHPVVASTVRNRLETQIQQAQDVLTALRELREGVLRNDTQATCFVHALLEGEPLYAPPTHPLSLLERFI